MLGKTMGRKKIQLDPTKIYEMRTRGLTQLEMAKELGVCHVTLSRRIADLQRKEGLLLSYREVQHLQLTALQARILEAITPEKIREASLTELVKAFEILKKAELAMNPSKVNISGLESYLIQLEKFESREI
jgi:hypothetical protein